MMRSVATTFMKSYIKRRDWDLNPDDLAVSSFRDCRTTELCDPGKLY